MDPLEGLGLSSGARVLVLGDAKERLRPDVARFRISTAMADGSISEPPGSFDAAIIEGCLEHQEWDRWTLQRVHRALKDGGRMVLIVPNMLALCRAADFGDLAARALRVAARAVAKALRSRPRIPGPFSGRRFFASRLRVMLRDLGFEVLRWDGAGHGALAPVAAVAPRLAERHACRHVVTCQKRPGYFGLSEARRYPDPGAHLRAYETEHQLYLATRDHWLARNPGLAPGAPRPLDIDRHAGREVLVLAPHPDDEIIGCGGTLLRLIAAGARVTIIQATDGSASLALRRVSEPARRSIRLDEARAVGSALGAVEVICWGEDNRDFRVRQERVNDLCSWLEAHRPSLVFTPFVTDAHADHFTLNLILAAAVAKASIDAAGTPVLGYEVWSLVPASHYCDISEVVAQRDGLLLLYPTAMKVDDFIHLCTHRNYYNAYTFMGREGLAEAFYEARLDTWGALLKTVEAPHA